MPFLYLPDAISLTLVTCALWLLRRAAVSHCRQELHRINMEALLYLPESAVSKDGEVYMALLSRISAGVDAAEKVTPARLFFAARLCERDPTIAARLPQRTPPMGSTDVETRKRLQRFLLESDVGYGMFYMFGSISGWSLSSIVLCRLVWRAAARKRNDRIGWAFDALERIFSRTGRRALKLACLTAH